MRFSASQLDELGDLLGVAVGGVGWTREELFVLSALLHRPLGLRSVRGVAVVAGVSPTTAAKVLRSLGARGLVTRVEQRLVEGKPVRVMVWRVDRRSDELRRLRPILRRIQVPRAVASSGSQSERLPRFLWHNFWNVDPASLSITRDGTFIAGRLLASSDPQSVAWLLSEMNPEIVADASQMRGIDQGRRSLAEANARR